MEVLVMIGTYAGQIRDVKPCFAREMIARGDALDPNAPLAPEPPAEPAEGVEKPAKRARSVKQ